MSEQTFLETIDELVNSMSREAQSVLIKIGLSWETWVGASGSYVYRETIVKLISMKEPWSINKLTTKGLGRNGVEFSLLPLLKEYELVNKIDGKNYTRYTLTETGKEVMKLMLFRCYQCNETRECQYCREDLNLQVSTPCRYSNSTYNEHVIETCECCDEHGNNICWQCNNTRECKYCIPYLKNS